jgi:predicted Fe-S protein YdhL (DUF1289 family)
MIPSPCKHICILEHNVCIGCSRTSGEISQWRRMTNSQKLEVLERIKNEKEKKE